MLGGQQETSAKKKNINSQDSASAPANLSQPLSTSLGKRLETDRLLRPRGHTIKDFTQDWLDQYLTGQPRSERTNWLSDDESEVASYLTAKNHLSESEGWLGLDDEPLEDPLKTPTASNFSGRNSLRERLGKSGVLNIKARHIPKDSTDTLKQADFWDFGYDQDAISAAVPKMDPLSETVPEEAGHQNNVPVSPIDKPLPPPPNVGKELPPEPLTPKPKQVRSVKKKIPWRSKQLAVFIPANDPRGTAECGGPLLTPADVQLRLKKWEEQGFDTRGFTEEPAAAQSRPAYPDPADSKREQENRDFGVRFPNRGEWDAYVNFLQEEKLRALGVSLGDDFASAPMSQTSSQFANRTVSPPIPTSSAGSNHLPPATNSFASIFNQSAKGNLGSITSPSSPFGFPASSPFSNQAISYASEPGYPFLPFQNGVSSQGIPTPQNIYGMQGGVSPITPGNLQNLGSLLQQPVSPLTSDEAQHFPGGFSGHSQFVQPFANQPQQGDLHNIISPPLEEPGLEIEADSDTIQSSSGPEIAHPTPRGHHHNVSETLQKGVEHPDFHLENPMHQDPEAAEQRGLVDPRWGMLNHGEPEHQHLPHAQLFAEQSHQEEARFDGSDIDTNPSLAGTPHNHLDDQNQGSIPPGAPFVPGHNPRTSGSSLHAGVPAFDPGSSFTANAFSFGANNFQPHNVNAPSFNPASSRNPKFHNFRNESISMNANFKFAAASPNAGSFNVDAPVFNPGQGFEARRKAPVEDKPKIFSNFDPSTIIVPPARKSKAIPIIRPENLKEGKEEEERETQGPGKRARMREENLDNVDKEPVFATPPTLPSAPDPPALSSQDKPENLPIGTDESRPDAGTEDNAGVGENVEGSSQVSEGTHISESAPWKPFEFKNEQEAAAFSLADAAAPQHQAQSSQEEEELEEGEVEEINPPTIERSVTPPTIAEPKEETRDAQVQVEKAKTSVLKPTAEAFEFKPAAPTTPAPAPIQPSEPSPPRKSVGLEGSKYAVPSPPMSPSPRPRREVEESYSTDNSENDSLDEQELDAVMRQLNDDSDVGIERLGPHSHTALEDHNVLLNHNDAPELASTILRSNAPSPSTRGPTSLRGKRSKLGSDYAAGTQLALSPRQSPNVGPRSPVRHLNNPENEHISDWDEAISSAEGGELEQRSRFFDTHVDEIIGQALNHRLVPLERTLGGIQNSLSLLASRAPEPGLTSRRSGSAEVEHSDADDEDESEDEQRRPRPLSPLNRRNQFIDKIKNALQETLSTHQASTPREEPPEIDLSEVHASLATLKALAMSAPAEDHFTDLKKTIVDSISNHPKFAVLPEAGNKETGQSEEEEKLRLQIDGLQSMLRLADERADQEYNIRRSIQDTMAESQRHLRIAEEDVARYKETAATAEQALEEYKKQQGPEMERLEKQAAQLRDGQETFQLTLSELSAKNISLQGTLEEHRVSSDNWRSQIEGVRSENKDLRQTISLLKHQMEDSLHARQSLRGKFDNLQKDLITATRDIALNRSSWRQKEEEQNVRYNTLKAQFDQEVRQRQKLELHIDELEEKEREGLKLKFILGQSQEENAKLEEVLMVARQEAHDYQSKALRYEREFNEARESSRVEIQRVRTSLESDLEAANHQVNFVRAQLETQLTNMENQVESTKLDADTAKARYDMLIEEARDSKLAALREAAEAKEVALEEQRRGHERTLNDLRERHARALHNSSEDRHRDESHYMEMIGLRDETIEHLHDKLSHMEEKLEIAKTAARTAAEAVQTAKATAQPTPTPSVPVTSPSLTFSGNSNIPEKISPQALRESIMVLQDQLQQREGRIEELEHELSLVDKDAPAKVKERETEINWLRELLAVRLDDLQDIIHVLSQPSFNKTAVRDAVIRLRANVQMQQQEKERAMAGGNQQFPSLASISTLAASPRALPLAAAAAWGNWRKGKENSASSNSNENLPNGSNQQTPSKLASNAQGFLSGLLTPPNSNMRQTPTGRPAPSARPSHRPAHSESRPLRTSSGPRKLSTRRPDVTPRIMSTPTTPPLLRKSSYDRDAKANNYGEESYEGDSDSTVSGVLVGDAVPGADGPFGPAI